MKVGIDVSPLSGGHAGRGTGTYTRELVSALKKFTDLEIVEIQQTNKEEDVDLIHYPYFDPFFLTLPLQKKKPTVVTVHDLIPLVYADHFPAGIKGTIKWQIQKYSIQGAAVILTDSEASKKDIVQLLGIPSERVFVVYLAPSSIFSPQNEEKQTNVRKKYNLSENFILYVGDVNWNKNIPMLIEAMKDIEHELVLVGKAFLNVQLPEVQQINAAIEKWNVESKITTVGSVPDEDLPSLYSAASAYVQPSIAEGFGLPVLEAMACGTPAVVSSKTSLGEIAGPAVLVDPLKAENIAAGIQEMLEKDRKKESDKALTWVKQFTWEKTAKQTEGVYKRVLE